MHATQFLQSPPASVPGLVALAGGERLLKQQVNVWLRQQVLSDPDSSETRLTGRDASWTQVADDLATLSMWGERRLIIVEDADEFVTRHRAALEKLTAKPPKHAVLVLDVKTWPKTTKLAKLFETHGLNVECSELKGVDLQKWLTGPLAQQYGKSLQRPAAQLLVELVGDNLSLLDQEVAKLAAYVGPRGEITAADVRALVVNWRVETTWAMTDAVRDGRLGDALDCLAQLLQSGEAALKLLGGIAYSFRKFAAAVELARSQPLEQALRAAGVFPQAIAPAAAYLRRIGRPEAERILSRLLTAEARLKGASRLPERIILEQLLLELAVPAPGATSRPVATTGSRHA